MNSTSPAPLVAFENQCSIIHNNILYVYTPDAFQTLELTNGAQWKQQANGVSVKGAVCVKGGVDGNSDTPALYVVGGTTNATTSNYSGIQRYSILDKSWTTINPTVAVASQRQYHGATYLNASSAILMYGGSQDGNSGPSTETFLMLMYPPYRIQAYSSVAPPVVNPTVLSWTDEMAVMVGGSATNQKVFLFHPNPGWTDLGLALPSPLPDKSIAQSSLVTLDDNSKILMTYQLNVSPNIVTRNVLQGPFNQPATYGETVGSPTSSAAAATKTAKVKRSTFLNTYPAYNSSAASITTRTGFTLANGDNNLVGFVGGDSANSVQFFDQFNNGWVANSALFGAQQPLTSSTSSGTAPTMTAFTNPTKSASATPTPATSIASRGNGLTILGAVLGAICGLAAILIILLLWLRQVRKRRNAEKAKQHRANTENKSSLEEAGFQPLSKMGQAMGRSPVPSAIIEEPRDSMAMFGVRPNEKNAEVPVPPTGNLRPQQNNAAGSLAFGFKRDKSPLTISKPMLPDLGDYQPRPSIELGKATPITPTIAQPIGLNPVLTALPAEQKSEQDQKSDQRKTDEGWAKYFQADRDLDHRRDTAVTSTSDVTTATTPSRIGRSGFWPGSGVPETVGRSPKRPLRDSAGRALTAHSVVQGSPNLESGPSNPATRDMSAAEGIPAKISRAESISTDVTDDDEYEDDKYEEDHITAYSSGVPDSLHDSAAWTPVGNTWSGPAQRPLRPPSIPVGAHDFPPPNISHNRLTGSSSSSIPAFPMPGNTIRAVQPSGEHPESTIHHDVTLPTNHTRNPSKAAADGSDMSWLNLGTPGR